MTIRPPIAPPARPRRRRGAWLCVPLTVLALLAACSSNKAAPLPSQSPLPSTSPSPAPTIPVPAGATLTATLTAPAHFLLFLGGDLAGFTVTRIEGKDADVFSQPLSAMQGVPMTPGDAAFAPALSPDRTRVVYVEIPASVAADPNSSGQGALVVQNIDGTGAHVIAASGPAGDNGSPSWSPDGKQIAFLKGDRLWVTAPDGSDQHALAVSLAVNTHIAWSPDGRKLAVGTGNPSRIAVVDLATLAYAYISQTGAQADHPAFSPDGSQIVYGLAGANALFVINADGTGSAQQITTCIHPDCIRDYEPTWSPDGAFIAFVRFAPSTQTTGAQQVYVVPATGGTARRVTSGIEEHAFPSW